MKTKTIIIVLVVLLIVAGVYISANEYEKYKNNMLQESAQNVLIQIANYQTSTGNVYIVNNNTIQEVSIKDICSNSLTSSR